MADNADENPPEKKIPVFIVIKNGSILKNIFLLDNPPSLHEEEFQMLVVGRHPDCNITLEHPSISRYHLRIHSNPSSHSLSVIDLSSVHGTWVSGKKIEPGVLVELKEGDTVRLGGSSRVYKLHWVLLNRAYDLDNPFLPPLHESKDCEQETHQDQNILCAETVEMKLPDDDDLEGLEFLFSNENLNLSVNEMCQLAPFVTENLNSTYGDEWEEENKIQLSEDQEEDKTFCGGQLDSNLVLQAAEIELPLVGEETEIGQPHVHSGNISELKEAKIPTKSEEWLNSPNIWSRQGMVASVQIHTGNSRAQSKPVDVSTDIEPLYQIVENQPASDTVSVGLDGNEEEFFTAEKENLTPNTHLLQSFKKTSRLEEIKQNSCRLSPLKYDVGPYLDDEKETVTTLDKENQEYILCESISKSLLANGEGNEEDVFAPDKENFSPHTLLQRYMKKMDKVEEIKRSEPVELFSSQNVFCPDIHQQEETLHSSDRENQTLTVLQGRKSEKLASNNKANFESKATIKKMPLQFLFVNSISRTKSNASVLGDSTRSCNSVNYTRTMEQNTVRGANKMWAMVVDTNCLLHRESRKALQLLQGIKGTQLIIPRIVIRELDHMKLRSSSAVSSVLQWIEDCMENTKWWIHVQSSVEEGMPIAPTPRALPLAQFTDEWGGLPFSSAQIATPTTEDNVLECALFLRRFMIDRQLVLLSDDISLKIKSMAEGVICETAEDFRESLVNPFSERFLWADSSPRGTTWSCMDDTVLRERYYPYPLKKPESLKGLKLILLHNSQYR